SAFRLLRSISDADVANGDVDLLTLTSRLETQVEIDGQKVGVKAIERYYTPPEIVRMVNRVGLKADRIYGGTAGNWRRGPIELDEYEFMVIGHRKPLQK
ncbi:MAG TPA: class I SAM-dependent methyltransferase, partial [Candidatus Rifleibacterium sp.]|nr:class I SAM-dependent methyltransferase [Candidatus Rifleibacterium sp.]